MAERSRQQSLADREIGPLPAVADPERRATCARDFRKFCETYFAETFELSWSRDQLLAIDRIQRTVLDGGLHALALPRGSGKSSLCEAAIVWALLYGHHSYVYLIMATDEKYMEEGQAGIKTILESAEPLAADFPEVCYTIRRLEGIAQRARGQLLHGERTAIKWDGKRLILPTVPGSPSSGAILAGGGLRAGTIRGARYRTRAGEQRRPSLLILDDPQTDESADSPKQTDTREQLLSAAVLGMAGPQAKLAALMPCTIIQRGDLAERFTDREKHPEWKGVRAPMILSWPERMDLWEQYREIQVQHLRTDEDLERIGEEDPAPEATEYYRAHRAAMDAGFDVGWPERKRPYHLDARQQAMDLYYRVGVRAFLSEYQQWLLTPRSPGDPDVNEDLRVDPDMLSRKLSGYDRYVLPPDTQWITGGVDVQQRVLYYVLLAVAPDFTCSIIDYGTYPETKRTVYYASTFTPTLRQQFPGKGQDGAVLAGLRALTQQIMTRPYDRSDGVRFTPSLLAIDSGYLATTVRRMVDTSPYAQLVSCLGRSIGPDELPMSEYRQRPGERLGENWLLRRPLKGSHRKQHLLLDKYHWADFAARRMLTADGDPGALTIYGREGTRLRHTFLARQLTAEVPTPKVGRNRVNIWDLRPGGETENHYWDALHYALVCASICGATIEGAAQAKPRPRTRWQAKF